MSWLRWSQQRRGQGGGDSGYLELQGHGVCLTVAHSAGYAGRRPEGASELPGKRGRCRS